MDEAFPPAGVGSGAWWFAVLATTASGQLTGLFGTPFPQRQSQTGPSLVGEPPFEILRPEQKEVTMTVVVVFEILSGNTHRIAGAIGEGPKGSP